MGYILSWDCHRTGFGIWRQLRGLFGPHVNLETAAVRSPAAVRRNAFVVRGVDNLPDRRVDAHGRQGCIPCFPWIQLDLGCAQRAQNGLFKEYALKYIGIPNIISSILLGSAILGSSGSFRDLLPCWHYTWS